jgi:hypothetical protein
MIALGVSNLLMELAMPIVATLQRNVFSGAYERMARLCGMLCRLGVLLALLQLVSWGAVAWLHSDTSQALQSARYQARMDAIDSVVAPSVAALVRTDQAARSNLPTTFEWTMNTVRETSRVLLWGIAILLLPMMITVGLLSPFVREIDSTRVLFGMIAVLGLLPLASAEAAPVFAGTGAIPLMPDSLLAGIAAPLVAAILLAAAAILVSPVLSGLVDQEDEHKGLRISPRELESIIRRGERTETGRIRSSR